MVNMANGRFLVVTLMLISGMVQASDAWRAYVQTKPLAEVGIVLQQRFAAEVISPNQTELAAELNARVLSISTRPGGQIKQGQVLVQLDCRDVELQRQRIRAQQKQTEANVALAELQLKRLEDLASRNLAAVSQLDEAQTALIQQRATLDMLAVDVLMAERQIERCQIKAPFDGVMVSQQVGVGQWVSVGRALLSLVQTSGAEIEVHVPLSWLNQQEQAWLVAFKAQDEVYGGLSLLRQAASVEARSRSVKLWFAAPSDLAIGVAGELSLTRPGLYIPANVIVKRGAGYGVYVVEQGQLQFRELAGAQEGRPYAIPTDWSTDMELVVAGQNRLNLSQP